MRKRTTSRLGNMGVANLNGDIICAIDTETTGLTSGFHDIIEWAVVPLDSNMRQITKVAFTDEEPEVNLFPFDKMIKPKRPLNADPQALRVNGISLEDLEINGLEPYRCSEMFEQWFLDLRLAPGKKIIPLAKNWAFDAGFIKELIGDTAFKTFFGHRVRELSAIVNFFNDRAEFHGEKCPFPQTGLQHVADALDIKRERGHRALDDALVTAEAYRRLLMKYLK